MERPISVENRTARIAIACACMVSLGAILACGKTGKIEVTAPASTPRLKTPIAEIVEITETLEATPTRMLMIYSQDVLPPVALPPPFIQNYLKDLESRMDPWNVEKGNRYIFNDRGSERENIFTQYIIEFWYIEKWENEMIISGSIEIKTVEFDDLSGKVNENLIDTVEIEDSLEEGYVYELQVPGYLRDDGSMGAVLLIWYDGLDIMLTMTEGIEAPESDRIS